VVYEYNQICVLFKNNFGAQILAFDWYRRRYCNFFKLTYFENLYMKWYFNFLSLWRVRTLYITTHNQYYNLIRCKT
jgi:hypothetical protein